MQKNEHYKDSGRYRICWCGPEGDRVYVAWVVCGKNSYGYDVYESIGVFKTGSDDERKDAAECACRGHHEMKKAS